MTISVNLSTLKTMKGVGNGWKECRLCRPIALSPQVVSPHRSCVAPTSKLCRPREMYVTYRIDRLNTQTSLADFRLNTS